MSKITDPPQERVVDPEDMACPQCQKPLTNPDDPCDCPVSSKTERYREWAEKIDDALCHAECTCRNHARRHLTYEERVDVITVKLAELKGKQFDPTTDLPTGEELNSLLEGADIARGNELKPPPQELEDAVTNILLEHGVASKPLTQDIVAAVQPFRWKPDDSLESAHDDLLNDNHKLRGHLDTAVRLLEAYHVLDVSGSPSVDTFLALPTIKDILKAQEADDA